MARPDPYLLHARHTAFIDYVPRYEQHSLLDFLLEVTESGAQTLRAWVEEGLALVNLAHLDAGSRFVTARMPLGALAQLESDGGLYASELAESLRHQRTAWPKQEFADKFNGTRPPPGQNASGTLVGIIDDGCPFAHREFRSGTSGGTRIAALWDMDPNPQISLGHAPPARFFRGREVSRALLDGCIAAHTSSSGVVDERACYRSANYSAVEADVTHGSHLLGLLAGTSYSRPRGMSDPAALADIAFMQLPRRESEAPAAGSLHACILDALRYLRTFAEGRGYQRCVVVCSWGSQLGPHDGSSLFERALDAFLNEGGIPFEFVFAAGNGYDAAIHAQLRPNSGKPASIGWVLPYGNEAPSFAELWMDAQAGPVRITVGGGGASAPVTGENSVAEVQPWLTVVRTGPCVSLRAAPTSAQTGIPVARPGLVTITATSDAPATLEGYLCWGGRNLGYARETKPSRWQALAGDDDVQITGAGSLLGDACGASGKLYVIGGFVGASDPQQYRRAAYSAAGPTRGGGRSGPSFLALSDSDAAHRGVPGPGTRSGIVTRVWGTSVAAPQGARAIVNRETLPAGGTNPASDGGGFLPP
ncbi:MAG TPA: S8 family serine peptidase [Ramlibacter sp.]|uniref:S8 family serine peptidase n=1 Tax=Ramlibacter sp. TaxID=1917967 RepID=UPI002D80C6DF|nr:S8 family serine peptidase [Ramlibacter sp.]HET8746288.1 S8 family serine peptidase [Ramlibacter sp.]